MPLAGQIVIAVLRNGRSRQFFSAIPPFFWTPHAEVSITRRFGSNGNPPLNSPAAPSQANFGS